MMTELAFSWVRFSFDTATTILPYKVILAAAFALVAGVAAPPYAARMLGGAGPQVFWALAGAVVTVAVGILGLWWWG